MSSPILSELVIYPVKSLRGVTLERGEVVGGRLAGDRVWILVDAQGRFMHQRDYPAMAMLEVQLGEGEVIIGAAGRQCLVLAAPSPVELAAQPIRHVRLWRRAAAVVPAGQEADEWFSDALGLACQLMVFAAGAEGLDVRPDERGASLHDATPFHLTSESSLADLNRRSSAAVPMNRFRPNVVVDGARPYAEDCWRLIRIGSVTLRWVRPCTRCVVTTTDQQTGARGGPEPLRTLSTYRRDGREVVFGHYLVADAQNATLRRGDAVNVLATGDG